MLNYLNNTKAAGYELRQKLWKIIANSGNMKAERYEQYTSLKLSEHEKHQLKQQLKDITNQAEGLIWGWATPEEMARAKEIRNRTLDFLNGK